MNPFVPYLNAIKVVAVLLLAAVLFGAGHHFGAQGVQSAWDADTAARAVAGQKAVLTRMAENEVERERNRENNRLLQRSYESEITHLRAAIDAAPRLRVGSSFCGGVPGQTQAGGASSSDGADPGGRLLPEEVDRAVKALIEETERAAATGRACQVFVQENGLAP